VLHSFIHKTFRTCGTINKHTRIIDLSTVAASVSIYSTQDWAPNYRSAERVKNDIKMDFEITVGKEMDCVLQTLVRIQSKDNLNMLIKNMC
jgi:hypothetical protein